MTSKHIEKSYLKISANLKKYRIMRGYSQEQLAAICNLSRAYIGQMENNQRDMRVSTILKLMKALNITFNNLLD